MERNEIKGRKKKQWENTERHHNMRLVYDAVQIAQIYMKQTKKNQLAMHFPLKMPVSQFFLSIKIKSWEFQLNFIFYSFSMKKKINCTDTLLSFFSTFFSLFLVFFFTTKLKIIERKKWGSLIYFSLYTYCVYTNRYAIFCVSYDLCVLFVRVFFRSVSVQVFCSVIFVCFTLKQFYILCLYYKHFCFFSGFLYRKLEKINRFLSCFIFLCLSKWKKTVNCIIQRRKRAQKKME